MRSSGLNWRADLYELFSRFDPEAIDGDIVSTALSLRALFAIAPLFVMFWPVQDGLSGTILLSFARSRVEVPQNGKLNFVKTSKTSTAKLS